MQNRSDRVLYLLFFLSGISALLYQVVWTKKLAVIFGVSAYAVSTTLSVFMLGLAAGSWYFGALADRQKTPLKCYVLLETGIAVSAALSLLLLEAMNGFALNLGFSSSASAGFIAFRILGAFLVLIVPTFFMGGTLPILARHCVHSSALAGRKLGLLYAVNTLGGVAGCLLAGFIAIPLLGMRGTLLAGVGINSIIALLASWQVIVLSRRASAATAVSPYDSGGSVLPVFPAPASPISTVRTPMLDIPPSERQNRVMLITFFFAGFLGLGIEVVWTRMLLLHVIATSQAFACMLAVYLLGLAAGSAIAAKISNKLCSATGYASVQILVGISIAACLFLWPHRDNVLYMALWVLEKLPNMLQSRELSRLVISLMLTALILFLPTVLMGFSFPLAARFFSEETVNLGKNLGSAFMFNTLGSMAGPLVCGFLCLPMLRIQNTLLLCAAGYIAGGTAVLLAFDKRSRRAAGGGIALLMVLAALSFLPEQIVAGAYSRLAGKLLFQEEDVDGSVAVIQYYSPLEDYRQLLVGTTSMIADGFRSRRYTRLIGHLPMLMHPAPRRALVVCLGSGMTLAAIASHADIESIDCADLSEGVLHASARFFSHVNDNVLRDPRVHVVVNDGRTHLLATREKYDVIALEPPPPNNAGVANLYSLEFYELCRSRLNPGGMIVQWIPYHCVTFAQTRSLLATLQAVFPVATYWSLFDGDEYCVVGHMDDAHVPYSRIATRLAAPGVQANLAQVGVRSAEDVLACFVMGPKKLREFTEHAQLVTDDLPGIGYDMSAFEYAENLDKIEIASILTARGSESVDAFFDFQRPGDFAAAFKPVKLAWSMHERAMQICALNVNSQTTVDLDRDFQAPISLDPGNPYYRFSNDSWIYPDALRKLAMFFHSKGDDARAKRFADQAGKLESLRATHLRLSVPEKTGETSP